MNNEPAKPSQNTPPATSPLNNPDINLPPPSQRVKSETTIQPSEVLRQEIEAQRQLNASQSPAASSEQNQTISPPASQDIPAGNADLAQAFALKDVAIKSKDTNRPVSLRVKSVLVIGIIIAAASVFALITSFGKQNGVFLLLASIVQLLMTAGLLFSRDQHTVGLILKIFLVFKLIDLVLSLANPPSLYINGIGLLLLGYAYLRVKSLRYF